MSAAADYDESVIAEAIDGCATGFIAKGSSEEVFRSAIELTLAGAIYIPERYLRARRRPGHSNDDPAFTPRERQIAGLLIQGLTYKQIAKRLSEPGKPLSDHTVRVHVQRMAWKLRVTDDPEKDNLAAKAAVLTDSRKRALSPIAALRPAGRASQRVLGCDDLSAGCFATHWAHPSFTRPTPCVHSPKKRARRSRLGTTSARRCCAR